MSERKRKHDAVSNSADDDRKPSAVAAADCSSVGGGTNKSAKLKEASDARRRSSKDGATLAFTDLPPGIVGKISTYIELSARDAFPEAEWSTVVGGLTLSAWYERDRRTLMSLCTAVGPSISSYIRKSYLEKNLSFITYLDRWILYNDDEDGTLDDTKCALVGAKLRQGMEYNP